MTFFNTIHKVQGMALVEGVEKGLGSLRRALTLHSTGKKPFTLRMYKEADRTNMLWIPRALVSKSDIPNYNNQSLDKPFKKKYILRPEQKKIVTNFIYHIRNTSPYGGIIKAPTGSGKTIIGIDILKVLDQKALIIVPTDRLMSQWKERIFEKTSLKEKDIGMIRQNICDVKDKQVVIGMVHSLARKKYSEYIYNYFGLVIFDEIHILGAETFSRTASMFNSRYRLGLSATPRRKDNMEKVFLYHIGRVVTEYKKQTNTLEVVMLPYNDVATSQNGCVWAGELQLGRYFNKLAKCLPRTVYLSDTVKLLYHKKREILVLSDRIQILTDMKKVLISRGIPRKDIGLFTGSTKQPDRKIILGTYGSAGLGIDIPRLNALVFATPRVDIEQAVGRLLRKSEDDPRSPIVIDITDVTSNYMIGWSKARHKFYKTISKNIINKI